MGDENKDTQIGVVLIVISVLFLISGMGLLEHKVLDEGISSLIAFGLVAYGVYLISRN